MPSAEELFDPSFLSFLLKFLRKGKYMGKKRNMRAHDTADWDLRETLLNSMDNLDWDAEPVLWHGNLDNPHIFQPFAPGSETQGLDWKETRSLSLSSVAVAFLDCQIAIPASLRHFYQPFSTFLLISI